MASSSSSKSESEVKSSVPHRVVDPKKQTLREELNDLALESFFSVADDLVHYAILNGSEDLMAIADLKAEERPQLKDPEKVRQLIDQARGSLCAATVEIQTQLEPSGIFEPIRAKRKLEADRRSKRELLERIVRSQYRVMLSEQVNEFNDRLREIINFPRGPMRYAMDLQQVLKDDGPLLDALDLAHLQQAAPSEEEETKEWYAQTGRQAAKRSRPNESTPDKV